MILQKITEKEQKRAAKEFAAHWKDKGYEKGQSQPFWLHLLRTVYGVVEPEKVISFEDQVMMDHTSFIDGYIPETKTLIEQKSLGKDLNKPIKQSDGSLLTPFQQAKRYSAELPYSQRPRWIVTSNFSEFRIYDMEKPNGEPEIIQLKDLPKEYYRMNFLVDVENENIKKEMEISLKAGEIVGKLYDALLREYKDPSDPETLKNLNILCVRLVFCLYAEDAGLFGTHLAFHDYLYNHRKNARKALIDLFRILDTPIEDRDPYEDDDLLSFPYVNGGLFANENVVVPRLYDEILNLILKNASENFDWSTISPTIFGAVFESTLNPETRRSGGMHYTSIENIHKVIDQLFLNDLKAELEKIKGYKDRRTRENRLREFQDKLASLTWLDPAAGSGNFLTETFICIRRLENEAIESLTQGQGMLDVGDIIKVSISQFNGIEINDFAVTVAKTALWIAESQMMKETEDLVHRDLEFFPLKTQANIIEGNALKVDWNEVVEREKLNFIMGNPPFIGARFMNPDQKDDIREIFKGWKNLGNLDYVAGWYKKAADFITDTVAVALVSTNSITQGESVPDLWKPLFDEGVHIDFAYRTFRWDSEASIKAKVHCVIVGFSKGANKKVKYIFEGNRPIIVGNINGYLLDTDNIFVSNRSKPISDVPEIGMGNQPIDDGNYLFSKEEMDAFIAEEPESKKYFHPWYGAREFINNKPRYCLYLGNVSPSELRKMPKCLERVESVKIFRAKSKRKSTQKLANLPTQFQTTNMPKGNYLVIPQVSSEKRKYIPFGYMDDSVLCSDKVRLMPNGNLYSFGVLESNVHMAWMRAICCRLKSDYNYTINLVYNNFPWPEPTEKQKAKIEKTAQAILDARDLYPDSSLADLYDELTMPVELRKAHQANDRAVMEAYGFSVKDMTESKCIEELFKLYQKKVNELEASGGK